MIICMLVYMFNVYDDFLSVLSQRVSSIVKVSKQHNDEDGADKNSNVKCLGKIAVCHKIASGMNHKSEKLSLKKNSNKF